MGYQFSYGAASVRCEFSGGVGVATYKGPITARVMFRLIGDIASSISNEGAAPDVCVADFSRAAFSLGSSDLFAAAMEQISALRCPGAVILPPDAIDVGRAYAWLMAREGVLRCAVTPDHRLAVVAWLFDRARALRADRDYLAAQATGRTPAVGE